MLKSTLITLLLIAQATAAGLPPSRDTATCHDPGKNICDSGAAACTTKTGRIEFDDGTPLGVQSTVLNHDDLTKGCYCQYAYVTFYPGVEPMSFSKPLSDNAFVTSCSPGYNAYWNGEQVMNTTGGTLQRVKNDGYTVEYYAMVCAGALSVIDTEAPSKSSNLFLLEWPSALQTSFETSLPNTLQAFGQGESSLCPGYDVQAGDTPNGQKTSQPSSFQNCTCHDTTSQYAASYGMATSYDGNTFATVCDSTNSVYWNGIGWRKKRQQLANGPHSIDDTCFSGNSNFNTGLIYVAPTTSGKKSSSTGNTSSSSGNSSSGQTDGAMVSTRISAIIALLSTLSASLYLL
jgi:hypothetical protein